MKPGLKHEKSCGCIIFRDEKVLLIASTDPDDQALFWSLPKGHQEPGETDTETALRETREEVGLEVEIIDPEPITVTAVHPKSQVEKTILIFLARPANPKAEPELQPEEVEVAEWLDLDEAEKRLANAIFLNGSYYQTVLREARMRLRKTTSLEEMNRPD